MLKQSQIIRDLEQQIAAGRFKPGQMLPTQKALMGHYGVAMDTIQQAMGQLKSRGIISSTRGRGTIVNDQSALQSAGLIRPKVELLALAGRQRDDSLLLADTSAVIAHQLSLRGVEMLVRMQIPEQGSALLQWAQSLQAVVVVGQLPMHVYHALREAGRPLVVFGELYDQELPDGVSQVTLAIDNMVDLAMTCIHMHGHRRIVLVRGNWSNYFKRLSTAFNLAGRKLGIESTCVEHPLDMHHPLENDAKLIEMLAPAAGATGPTAVLVDNGRWACRLIFALQHAGLRVGSDVSVMALNSTPREQLPLPQLSRVEVLPELMGQKLADVLLQNLRANVVVRDHLPPALFPGSTLATNPQRD